MSNVPRAKSTESMASDRECSPVVAGDEAFRMAPKNCALLGLVFVFAAILLYSPILDGEFVFDDQQLILNNSELWQGWGFDLAVFADQSDQAVRTNFRPVRFVSYKLDALLTQWWYDLSGPVELSNPPPTRFFHLQNVFWHAINSLLVAVIIALFLKGLRLPAILGASLFLLHPIHSESVAYISGRRDVLFLFFYLLAIAIYMRARIQQGQKQLNWPVCAGITLLYTLAVFTKEMAATLPATLIIIEYWTAKTLRQKFQWQWRLQPILLLTLVVAVGGLLKNANPGHGVGYWGGDWFSAVWTSARSTLYGLKLLFWPSGLTVDYSYDVFTASAGALDPWTGIAAMFAIGALLLVAILAWRRDSIWLAGGIVLFFVLWSPVSQAVFPHPERFAERFLYLPSLAILAVSLALFAPLYRRWRAWAMVLIGMVMLASIVALESRLPAWRSGYALWQSAVEQYPDCARAQFAFANEAKRRSIGRSVSSHRYLEQSLAHLDKSIELYEQLEQRSPVQQGWYLQAVVQRIGLLELQGRVGLEQALSQLLEIWQVPDTDGVLIGSQFEMLRSRMKMEVRLGKLEAAVTTAMTLFERSDASSSLRIDAALVAIGMLHEGGQGAGGLGSVAQRTRAWTLLEQAALLSENSRQSGRLQYVRGEMLQAEERWSEAAQAFVIAGQLYQGTARWVSARFKEAECLRAQRKITEAYEVINSILEQDSQHFPSLLSRANMLLDRQLFDRAEADFRTVYQATKSELALQGLQQVQIHREVKLQQKDKKPSAVTRLKTYMRLTRKMLSEGKAKKAADALRKAERLAEGPDLKDQRRDLRLLLAEVHCMEKNWVAAAEAYESFLKMSKAGERDEMILNYPSVLRKLGRESEIHGFWQPNLRRRASIHCCFGSLEPPL